MKAVKYDEAFTSIVLSSQERYIKSAMKSNLAEKDVAERVGEYKGILRTLTLLNIIPAQQEWSKTDMLMSWVADYKQKDLLDERLTDEYEQEEF